MGSEVTNEVGAYEHTGDGWRWTPALLRLYGHDGDGGLAGLLERVHPADREKVRTALEEGQRSGRAFGLVHRLDGDERRRVVLSGSPAPSTTDAGWTFAGVAAELGGAIRATTSSTADQQLQRALRSHATVDQAKGALMLVYGLDDDQAFDLLRWSSMRLNRKLALLAERLVAELRRRPSLMAETRDALVCELDADAPDALRTARCADAGARPSVVASSHGAVPAVVVSGWADLRAAQQLHAALEATWPTARLRGRLVIDTRDSAWAGAASRGVLAGAARRGTRERVAVRVLVPPGDPLGLRRDLPPAVLARTPGMRELARPLPA